MGRRKAKSSRIFAIHYKSGDKDEVYYLDRSGRHIDREIEKLNKPKQFPFTFKYDFNETYNRCIINENKIQEISRMPTISNPPNNIQIKCQNKNLSSKFYEACNKFPAASLMWINNPEYSNTE